MANFVIKIIEALLVAVPTAFLTARFSLKRYYSEKWWERKIDTYTAIFNALYHMKNYCEEIITNIEIMGEDALLKEHQNLEINNKYYKAIDEIKRVTDIGAFVVSEKTIESLKDLDSYLRETDFVEHIIDLDQQLSSVEKCLESIRVLAKIDLKVENKFSKLIWP